MWNRKELKRKGKAAFKANYWRCVLVALLIVFVLGSSATAVRTGADRGLDSGSEVAQLDTDYNQLDTLLEQVPSEKMPLVIAVVAGVFLVALVVFVLVDALLFNPLEVGCRRFFLVNTDDPASLRELVFGYENRYGNVVQTILLRDIYLFLWSLLFIFPVFIKSYSYRLVPYILSENPEMKPKEAITLSRQLMKGQKWRAFVLDLSFIGWDLLAVLTLGLVGLFYSNPYLSATRAELYKAIRYGA